MYQTIPNFQAESETCNRCKLEGEQPLKIMPRPPCRGWQACPMIISTFSNLFTHTLDGQWLVLCWPHMAGARITSCWSRWSNSNSLFLIINGIDIKASFLSDGTQMPNLEGKKCENLLKVVSALFQKNSPQHLKSGQNNQQWKVTFHVSPIIVNTFFGNAFIALNSTPEIFGLVSKG